MTPVEALNSDEKLLVVTTDLIRRREIAVQYTEAHWGSRSGRWANTGWIRLLNRIILVDQIAELPDPKPPLFYDEGVSDGDNQ